MSFWVSGKNSYGETAYRIGRIATIATVGVVLVIFLCLSITTVPAGHRKVLDVFGVVASQSLEPGFSFQNPFAKVPGFSVRTLEVKERTIAPSNEGLPVTLDCSLLFHADASKVVALYKTVGKDYLDVLVVPNLRSVVRDVIADHKVEDLYTASRAVVAKQMEDSLTPRYAQRGIVLEALLIRDIQLPQQVVKAIEAKMAAKQASEQMEWTLEKAKKEIEVKTAEATGIAQSQAIISKQLTPEYIQWYYIKSLEALVGSPNTTWVILPFDQKLIPMLPLK